MGSGFPVMSQARSSAGPRINVTPLLDKPLRQGFVTMPWKIRRCPRIVLENVLRSHVSCRKYQCMPLVIIRSIVLSILSLPVSPCTFWFITWTTWGQVSPDLVCTLECNYLRWLADGVSPPWYYFSVLGNSSLNRYGVSHGAGWGCWFPFEGRRRRGRLRSPYNEQHTWQRRSFNRII